jgi:hypothetical protein
VALASTQFTNLKKIPVCPGTYMVTGTFTGPASYTSGGEDLTHALALSSLGIRRVNSLHFTDLIDENNTALGVSCQFDHNRTTTSQGKIRFLAATRSQTHDMKIIGGQAAAATDTVFVPAATDILGKQEATNADVLGADVLTKGGVMLSTQQEVQVEVSAATALNGYICRFVAYGC